MRLIGAIILLIVVCGVLAQDDMPPEHIQSEERISEPSMDIPLASDTSQADETMPADEDRFPAQDTTPVIENSQHVEEAPQGGEKEYDASSITQYPTDQIIDSDTPHIESQPPIEEMEDSDLTTQNLHDEADTGFVDDVPPPTRGESVTVMEAASETPIEERGAPIEVLEASDLSAKDLSLLGISEEEISKAEELESQAEALREEGRIEEAEVLDAQARDLLPDIEIITEEHETAIPTEEFESHPELAESIDAEEHTLVEITTRVYEIEHDNSSITKTSFTYNVAPPADGSDIELVVEIPKDIAAHVSDITFSIVPSEIINPDPVIKWVTSNVPQDKTVRYSFTVDGNAANFETTALAAAERPGFVQRIMRFVLGIFGFA